MTSTRLALAALAAIALAASASSALADTTPSDPFAAFVATCATPAADFAGVKSAADAQGWADTDTKADASMAGVTVTDQMTRASSAGKTGLVLSAWRGSTKSGVKVSDCTVHVAKADFQGLKGAAGAWLAFPAQEDTPKRAIFRFTDLAGAHRALTPAEFDAAAAAAGLEMLTVSGDASGTVLDLLVIKK